ncbi:hypothetical protein H9P43_005747 [Blastocladiella emersonii ATCC 22665]|nr:hypothetical protein H9P43_005747 [Blastocladiella emersonii ATCC 22665]
MQPLNPLGLALAAVAVAATLPTLASAMYEDQAGKFDWHIESIGKPKDLHWAKEGTHAVVASERAVGLADAANQGKLVWRHVLPADQTLATTAVCGKHLATVADTRHGPLVQVWTAASGSLVAQTHVSNASPSAAGSASVVCTAGDDAVLVLDGTVYVLGHDRATSAGTLTASAWGTSAERGTVREARWTGTHLWALTQHSDTLSIVYGAATADEVPTTVRATAGPVAGAKLAGCTKNKWVVFLKAGAVHAARVTPKWEVKDSVVSPLPVSGNIALSAVRDSCFLRLDGGSATAVIKLDAVDGKHAVVYKGPRAADSARVTVSPTTHHVQVQYADRILDVADDGSQAASTVFETASFRATAADEDDASVTLPTIEFASAPSPATGVVLVVTADHNLHLVSDSGAVAWTRHEALASIRDGVIVDYPEPHSWEEAELPSASVLTRWMDRWSSHLAMARGALNAFVADPMGVLLAALEPSTDAANMDAFGFRKLAVFLTHSNAMYAVDSARGDVVWSRVLADKAEYMDLIRGTVGSDPALVRVVTDRATLTVNPFTGEIATGMRIVTPAEEVVGRALPTPLPAHVHRIEGTTVQGFAVVDGGDVVSTFNITLPGDRTAAVALPRRTKVASAGRVMGDRSVRYKYLNPNVAAVVTRPDVDVGELRVALLDTVSGHVLGSYAQVDVDWTLPVHAVRAEHWTVLVYWNRGLVGPAGWTVTVLEMFAVDQDSAPLAATSFAGPRPIVHAASFALAVRDVITGLGVTSTRNGIAVADVVYTTTRSVATIPRRLADALRASTEPKEVLAEAGIVPYAHMLPMGTDDRSVVSHTRHVVAPRIATAATHLESTSAVLAFGFDVFWTRVTPSGAFDQLSESFGKGTLLLTCAGLAVAAVAARAVLNRKLLRIQWQ